MADEADIADITNRAKLASSAFTLMKGMHGGDVQENIRITDALTIEKAEFTEKNGNEMLHVYVDEDAEFWAIKTKDERKILALKTEEEYFYYAVSGNDDKQLTLVAQDDMVATLKTNILSDKHSVLDSFIQMTEGGKQTDISSRVVMKDNGYVVRTDLSEDNKKIAQINYSMDAKGHMKISGYGETGAFSGKSKVLSDGERSEGTLFEAKVLKGTTIVDNEIWHCENDKLSLVGVINKETDKNTKSLCIAGKDISYQPVSDLPPDELDYIIDKLKRNKKEILETLGGQHITVSDILYGNTLKDNENSKLKQDLSAQSLEETTGFEGDPVAEARHTRLGLRLASRKQSGETGQNLTNTTVRHHEVQVDLSAQKGR